MSKNDRGGVPGFADPALDALESNFQRSGEGRRWADVALTLAQLPLEVAERIIKEAQQLPEVVAAKDPKAAAVAAKEIQHPPHTMYGWDIPG